ncbi:ABC transporter permease [Pilimelia columellifera]|uniref:ABC transporter permease n=1 Tax=Pilimelia columellifera subsp. columellifera TaxID=706583 RepID=A0ABN3NJ34_9ACTN
MSDPIDSNVPTAQPGDLKTPVGGEAAAMASNSLTKERNASLWADAWRQLRRNPVFIIAGIYVALVTSMALFPTLWTSQDPRACNVENFRQSPSAEHIFGTNTQGCDYFSHAVYGARPSLLIALLSTVAIIVLGGLLGLLAGFYGGAVDGIISRVMDVFFSLPFLLGAIVFLTLIKKQNVLTLSLVLVVLGWTTIARIIRGSVISAKSLDYVQAARALGATNSRLMFRHILPNATAPMMVYATIMFGGFVSAEATLTYLGVGLQAPAQSWGIMISSNEQYFLLHPYLLAFPCALLVGTVLSFILMGDALRDALDPKLR